MAAHHTHTTSDAARWPSLLLLLLSFLLCQDALAQSNKGCPHCDLRGRSFAGQDLTNANFNGTMLDGADFRGAILSGAIFANASLAGAHFDKAVLTASPAGPANFSGANLTDAVFADARMNGVVLQYANISGTDFSRADLSDAILGATLRTTANPRDAAFKKPKLNGATLSCDFRKHQQLLDLSQARLATCDTVLKAHHTSPTSAVQVTLPTDRTEPVLVMEAVAVKTAQVDSQQVRQILPDVRPATVTSSPADTTWVSTSGNDGPDCGRAGSPCRTISQAVSNAPANNTIAVEYGEYAFSGTVEIPRSMTLIGGFFSGQPTIYQSLVQSPPDGAPAFVAKGSGVAVRFINFMVNGSSATSQNRPSIAVQATDGATLTLAYTHITAGKGGPGAPGTQGEIGHNGAAGGTGNANNDGKGGTSGGSWFADGNGGKGMDRPPVKADCSLSWYLECTLTYINPGGKGGDGGPGSTGSWALGSNAAGTVAYQCPSTQRPSTAGNGADGKTAFCGGAGVKSTNITGTFSGSAWSPSRGGEGPPGGNGGGGGGGGFGGNCSYCNCGCGGSGYQGTAGGGGGGGGGGGRGGIGGMMGGASWALLLQNASFVADGTVRLTGGRGGRGGDGGTGNSGGTGGGAGSAQGASDVCNNTGGQGGAGGKGGTGGAGGGAAGGNGGPAFCIAKAGNCYINGAPVYYRGASGDTGNGGSGGTAAGGGNCNGTQGEAGTAGMVDDTFQY